MTKQLSNQLKKLSDILAAKFSIKKIILFGSYAYGNPTKDSDIDLCIITDEPKRKIDLLLEIQAEIYKIFDKSFDILVYKSEEFEYRVASISTIEKTIAQKGKVIYG
jgi:predicted nucleotidyltransferase